MKVTVKVIGLGVIWKSFITNVYVGGSKSSETSPIPENGLTLSE